MSARPDVERPASVHRTNPFGAAEFRGADPASAVAGPWILVEEGFSETRVTRIHLEVAGRSVSGHTGVVGRPGSSWFEGQLEDAAITLKRLSRDRKRILRTYAGLVADGRLEGRARWNDLEYGWRAHRPVERPAGEHPTTRQFAPQSFHRVVSASLTPALALFPGDTVHTTTLDAAGVDGDSVQRTVGGNPVSGPFHVAGAVPGDTLVVHLKRVTPNRTWARGGTGLIPEVLTSQALRGRTLAGGLDRLWRLDPAEGVARVDGGTGALSALAIPLCPMLGYIGTAPEGTLALSTRDAGAFGGNMDCRDIQAGATVYLPVFHEGGLLFVGDGHAAQGDGELNGDALEISLDVEFTVDVLPDLRCGAPRVETPDAVAIIGAGGSLDQAVRSATSAALAWLERRYRLTTAESSLVVGSGVEYRIAALAGPQVCVSARIPRRVLQTLKAGTSGELT